MNDHQFGEAGLEFEGSNLVSEVRQKHFECSRIRGFGLGMTFKKKSYSIRAELNWDGKK